jgi:23S rRNA (uridine2552-2'-O)-methyltransferase
MKKKGKNSKSSSKNLIKGGRAVEDAKIKNKKLKKSSRAWLERQMSDPFVKQAQQEGYRGRAVYKLIEIDNEFKILKKGQNIVDLGAAPGSWCQYIVKKLGGSVNIVGVDLKPIDSIDKCHFIEGDFTDNETLDELESMLDGRVNLVLSDMAPNTTGHPKTDHLRIMFMLELALDFAVNNLEPGGNFVAKVFQGGAEKEILNNTKKYFSKVKHFKPQASRKESSEMYLIALGFKGL